LILAPEFYLPLKELGTHYHAKQEAIAAAERLMDLFDELDRAEIGGDQEPPIGAPSIHLSNIGFSYAAHLAPVLQNLDLTLRSGECVALVGPSGVGKSSLLSVLAGFDRPQHGAVLVEGIPLSALKRSSWMKRIALVSQHTTLFPGSIRDNLLMARPEATDSQLEMACEQAALTGFIEQLPKGLDTPVGEAGLGFSGGQIQRLSLARAFLKDAPILLLDEPTASLDAENEQKVLESLRLLCRGRTTLLVTHRPASMAIADRVYRLVDGRCEEINEVNMAKGGV
jgi:ATP-binding cassette subfamily C protein CydD